ncbi:MAG: response regulator [Desulfobacteraceae bacterium]
MKESSPNPKQETARKKFLALGLESTRKSYYPQLKRQLEAARKNEKQLQLIIDNMPALVSYVDNHRRYVLVNRTYEKIFNVHRSRIIGQSMAAILGAGNYEKVKDRVDKALSGSNEHFETSFEFSDGSRRWFDINYVPETIDTSVVKGFYSFCTDLTEKKQAEKEKAALKDRLRQTQKMEAIGTLSGGIAHDFNNILSGLFGYSQLAQLHIHEPEKAKGYIGKIVQGAQRASSLIQQILSFSRQTQQAREAIHLDTLLKEVLKLLRSTLPSNIEIKERVKKETKVLADSTQMHQVIMNLCTNAYQAMADTGGLLTITLDEVDLAKAAPGRSRELLPGRYVTLEVSDTGPGIDPAIQEKIFDPYFTTKAVGKGTGLGLAVVDGIVKKHGGSVTLAAGAGGGTTFQVYLPALEGDKENHGAVETSPLALNGTEKIMLVDDEAAILETVQTILTSRGYRVSSFDNGRSALKAFQKTPHEVDLIITDMTMPRMTGEELSRRVLNIRPDLPIILSTGFHERFTEEQALKAGIRKYIEKPVMTSNLLKMVREVLDTSPP